MYKIILFLSLILIISCKEKSIDSKKYLFEFRGPQGKEAVLYKIEALKKTSRAFLPIQRITTGEKILLPKGRYFIANQCTSFEFEHSRSQKIVLGSLKLQLSGKLAEEDPEFSQNNTLSVVCIDPFDKKEHWFQNKTELDILPGKNSLFVGGRKIELKAAMDSPVKEVLNLNSVTLKSPSTSTINHFFISSLNSAHMENNFVVS
ncbi:MAG: hypothetical protein K2X39_08520, partial [Silvanigrellaceae bacterium]|nr:hypothetical protein [Silvanigrellaceae bacterium]